MGREKPPRRPASRFEGVVVLLWLSAFGTGVAAGIATGWAIGNYGDRPSGGIALVAGIGAGLLATAPLAGLAAGVRLLQSIDERLTER